MLEPALLHPIRSAEGLDFVSLAFLLSGCKYHHNWDPMLRSKPSTHRSRWRLEHYESDEEERYGLVQVVWRSADVGCEA